MSTMTPEAANRPLTQEDSFLRQEELLDDWVGIGREIAALEAQRAELLAARLDLLARERSLAAGSDEMAFRSMSAEYAAAGHLAPGTASRQITDAWVLARLYPATLASLAAGAISKRHVDVILEEAPNVSGVAGAAELRAQYEHEVLGFAENDTAARTRVHARGVAARVAPESTQEQHRRARSERTVTVRPDGEGMAVLTAILPELLAHAIHDRLTTMARELIKERPKAERRPRKSALDAIRAERAAAVATQAPSNPDPTVRADGASFSWDAAPEGDPSPWEAAPWEKGSSANAVPDAGVFRFGDADDAAADDCDWSFAEPDSDTLPMHDGYGPAATDTRSMDQIRADLLADLLLTAAPTSVTETALESVRANVQVTISASTLAGLDEALAEFDGHGPLSPEAARILAGHAGSWDRIFLNPAGMAVRTDNYVPTAGMKRFLRVRDQHCRFPGCRAAAHRCQIDHNHDHAKGGRTELCNLALFCNSHHPLKHPDVDDRDRWTATQLDDGVIVWTSPLGRRYTDEPQLRVMFV